MIRRELILLQHQLCHILIHRYEINMTSKDKPKPANERKQIYLKPHLWDHHEQAKGERDDNIFEIRSWGVDKDNNPTCLRVQYQPKIWLGLPDDYEWDETRAHRIYVALCDEFEKRGGHSAKPVSYVYNPNMHPLYSAYLRNYHVLELAFDTQYAYRNALYKCKWPMSLIPGMEPITFTLYNEKLELCAAFVIHNKLDFTSWIEFKAQKVSPNNKITKLEHEYLILPKEVTLVPFETCKAWPLPKYKIAVMDGEMFAERATAMPKASNDEDVTICIGVYLVNRDDTVELHAFCAKKKPNTPSGVVMHYFDEEEDMIKAYSKFIDENQPDEIVTHNGMGWDEEYYYTRLATKLIKWPNDSRLKNHIPTFVEKDWDSSAYNNMRFHYITRPGVIHYDLLPWSKRSFRLDSYKLDELGKRYLGKGKISGNEDAKKKPLSEKEILEQAQADKMKADDAEMGEQIDEDYLEAHQIFEFWQDGDPDKLRQIIGYCVGMKMPDGREIDGDCGITYKLFMKLQMRLSIMQMSKVAMVQPADVFMKGQQIRTFNQVAKTAYTRDILMTKENPPRIPVKGAHVFPPIRGRHEYIFVFDFKGLYPSIIRRYNLCLTTYIPNRFDPLWKPEYDLIPDEKCHVFKWVEKWYDKELQDWADKKKKGSSKVKNKGNPRYVLHEYRFLKEPRGIFPDNLDGLASERELAKDKMKPHEKGSFLWNFYNQEQEADKVCMNSAYGGFGSDNGKLPNHKIAAVVTRMARKSAKMMARFFKNEYDGEAVYGDTDSAFIRFGDKYKEEYMKDPWAWGKRMAKECTALFDKPQELEFEKVFETLVLTNKKQYAGTLIPEPDKVTNVYSKTKTDVESLMTRGLMYIKRGNAKCLQDVQKKLVHMAVLGEDPKLAEEYTMSFVNKLMTLRVPEKELTVVQKIGVTYKSENHPLEKYRKHLVRSGKMVNPGDRYPFIFVKNARNTATGEYNPKPTPDIRVGGYSEAVRHAVPKLKKKAAAKNKLTTLLEPTTTEINRSAEGEIRKPANRKDGEEIKIGATTTVKEMGSPMVPAKITYKIETPKKKPRKAPAARKKPAARKRVAAKPKEDQGDKMEHPELRKANKQVIDPKYYLDKRGIKPIDTILEHGFGIKGFMKKMSKYLGQREKMCTQLALIGNEAYIPIKGEKENILKKLHKKENGEMDYIDEDRKERKKRKKEGNIMASEWVEDYIKELKEVKKEVGGVEKTKTKKTNKTITPLKKNKKGDDKSKKEKKTKKTKKVFVDKEEYSD